MARCSAGTAHLSLSDWWKCGVKLQHGHLTQIEILTYFMRHQAKGEIVKKVLGCQNRPGSG
jgi:hypothetical protein